MSFKTILLFIVTTAYGTLSFGQVSISAIQNYLQTKKNIYHYTGEDIAELKISDEYTTDHNGVRHIYVNQQFHNIPVYNAITAIHIDKNGRFHVTAPRFVTNLKSKIVGTSPKISAIDAVKKAVRFLKIPNAVVPDQIQTRNEKGYFVLNNTNFSNSPVIIKQVYTPAQDGKVYLCWDLAIDRKDNADYMSLRIDALTGSVIDKNNFTTYCDFNNSHAHTHRQKAANSMPHSGKWQNMPPVAKGAYRVIPLPGESPLHAPFELVQNPADDSASPLGWHDNHKRKYTITRGNNVHAYTDENNTSTPSSPEPDGGADLVFDFPYDSTKSFQSQQNKQAAVTNLFYTNNRIHDILYHFGFDEKAGNFQDYNFGKGGSEGDHVVAQAQDGSGRNNANFSTPPDGSSGQMQMFIWDGTSGSVFSIVQDDGTTTDVDVIPAAFGGKIPSPPIEVQTQEANDHSLNPTRACNDPLDDMTGKVAIIDRGTCEFGLKSLNAQNAGAIAVLICGFDDSRVSMAGGQVGDQVTIPAFYAPRKECQKLRVLEEGTFKVKIGTEEVQDSSIIDGDFDNGVITHEFSHGISNRLTGGPSSSGCLSNGEQMGEGWSDFFALVLTHREGDKGADPRGIGNFVTAQPIDGPGIRTKPYSTDFKINDFTYATARTLSIPHGVGSVWCTMIWEMYWAFVDEYGFDPDLSNKKSGNAQAIQLVVDGMKLQPCTPGFVDGRDAILLADSLNNGAANSCLIWKAFAKRGLGYGANQGTSNSIGDVEEKESFELPPICQNQLRITKTMTDQIKAGEQIEVTLNIANNFTDTSRNIVIKDIIPDKTSYVQGSANITPVLNGNTLTWTIDEMNSLEQLKINYSLLSDENNKSVLHWEERIVDDLEVFETTWEDIVAKGTNNWDVTDEFQNEGPWAFYAYSDPDENDIHLFLRKPIKLTQEQPVLRFYHWYNMTVLNNRPAVGTVELSVDGGAYTIAKDLFIKNGFTGPIPYGVFVEPFYQGFYGDSKGFIQSYIDLSKFKGKDFKVKFRFGNEDLEGTLPKDEPYGWVIDDIELIDLKNYNSQACVAADNRQKKCASAPGKGTLVEVGLRVDAKDVPNKPSSLQIYPNPAKKFAVLKFNISDAASGNLEILQSDKVIFAKNNVTTQSPFLIPVQKWSPGMYIVRFTTRAKTYTQKLIVTN